MKKGAIVECQVILPIFYDNIRLKSSLRIDLLVNQCLIVEIKSIEAILPVHVAQVLTYLKLSGCRLALLINFNTTSLNNGVKRIIL
ncbi:GxxExxY protein [Methanocella conradii]|uniref:GxxExxY protein n=1 Tax=Methanocella conradii TaxID=1175444 RepID=UPI0024B3B901|nr:GxxExxY protein [Methanocella conradii]MDI6897931.1 GxxExxY protein [Methanocella conradii]